MPERNWRLGVYECKVDNGIVSRLGGSPIWYTYVSFPTSDVEDYKKLIYDGLTIYNRAKKPFQYPILVMSWRLGPGEQKENKAKREDRHTLFASRVGGIRELKKEIGFRTDPQVASLQLLPEEAKPDRPTTSSSMYSTTAEIRYDPIPPEPYETFDEKTAY